MADQQTKNNQSHEPVVVKQNVLFKCVFCEAWLNMLDATPYIFSRVVGGLPYPADNNRIMPAMSFEVGCEGCMDQHGLAKEPLKIEVAAGGGMLPPYPGGGNGRRTN